MISCPRVGRFSDKSITAEANSSSRSSRSNLRFPLSPSRNSHTSPAASLDVGCRMLDVGCLFFFISFLFLRPPRHQLVGQAQMVEHARHHRVHDLLDRLGAGVL